MNKNLTLGLCVVFLLAGCAPSAGAVGTAIALTQGAIPSVTSSPAPSETSAPSATFAASATKTNTPSPTLTPTPSPTALPTFTPAPTDTSAPPTATSTPISFTGSGDSVINLTTHCECVAHITGNKASRFFAVETLDANGKTVNLLVNATDPYDGYKPFDFLSTEDSVRIKVTAVGGWKIELVNLFDYDRFVMVPGHAQGTGDDVLFLKGGTPDLLNISGNPKGRFFAVESWSTVSHDLLVNATDPYSGTVPIASSATLLQVTADGAWSIDVTAK